MFDFTKCLVARLAYGDRGLNTRIQALGACVASLLEFSALRDPFWRRIILLVAAFWFAAGVALSFHAKPDTFSNLQWQPVLWLVIIAIPLTLALNAYEFVLSAQLIGQQIGFRSALETTIIGGVANMLPLPGGIMVRVAALKAAGASLKHSTSTILFSNTLLWFGVAFTYAGAWIGALGSMWVGTAFLATGLSILTISFVATLSLLKEWRITMRLTATKIGLVVTDAARIYLCFWALTAVSSFAQASVLTASSVIGSAISIVPAGLGIRESVAALMAPVVGLAASSAFLATSLNRLVGLAIIAPVAAYLAVRQSGPGRQSNQGVGGIHQRPAA
jgi:uncharacterized membrane protein YbhN (UPF0104 family)